MTHHQKTILPLAIIALASALQAAVPLAWQVETTRANPAQFDAYRGETLALEATMLNRGTALDMTGTDPQLFWQTNGMGTVYWSVPASATSNVLSAVWAPSNDVGAAYYNCFIGSASGSYRAAFRLRMIAAPGFEPETLQFPVQTLDFSTVTVANPPYYTQPEVDALLSSTAAASTNYTDEAVAAATNPIPAMIEQAVVNAGGVTESITNGLASIAYVDASTPGDYANVSNRAMNALSNTNLVYAARGLPSEENGGWFEVNGEKWEFGWGGPFIEDAWICPSSSDLFIKEESGHYILLLDAMDRWSEDFSLSAPYYEITVVMSQNYTITGYVPKSLALSSTVAAAAAAATNYTDAATNALASTLVATETDPVYSADKSSIDSAISDLQTESALVYRLYSGSNVVCEVTNYNSTVRAPTMRLMQLSSSNTYDVVWTETNGLARIARAATNYTDSAISSEVTRANAAYAPKAWSGVTSGLGAEAPSETTWISTPKVVIGEGVEFSKVVTTSGTLWVLASNGMTISTNQFGFFSLGALDGTPIFSVEKTDAYLVGADADGITVSGNTVTIPLSVVSPDHPYLRYATSLTSPITWYKEEESNLPSGVSCAWSGTSGAWVCTVTVSASASEGFFYFEFLQEGSVKIINNGVTDLSAGIYYNGVRYLPSVSGTELKFIAE